MQFYSHMLRLFVALFCLVIALGCESLDKDDSGVHVLDLEGRVAVLVIDNSGGPEEFDPDEVIREGAKFLLSTFSPSDNLGIVTVRFPVETVLPITYLGSEEGFEKATEALDAMKIGGDAEYYSALKKAHELLDLFSATEDSAVVFLTGGRRRPSGNPDEIRHLMKSFGDRGWRFFPVVITPAPDLMGVLEEGAAQTQGAVFKVERPNDIMPVLMTVSGKVNDLWVRRDTAPAVVPEGARRLVVAVTRGDDEANLEKVTHDDGAVALDPVPEGGRATTTGVFDTVSLKDPGPGTWAGEVSGKPVATIMYVKPPFEVFLDSQASAKGAVLEGDEMSFHLVVRGEKEDIEKWGPQSSAEIAIFSETTGKSSEAFTLEKTFVAPELRFSGKTRLYSSEPGVPEVFTARITLVFGEGENAWTREEFLSFMLRPAKALLFRAEPSDVDLGVRWSDEKDISRNVEILARVDDPVDVKVSGLPEGLVVEPQAVSASKSQSGLLRVAIGESLKEQWGENSLEFKIEGASAEPDGPSFERVVKVSYRLLKFRGPTSVPVGPTSPGQERKIPLSSWTVDGGTVPISMKAEPLEGPGVLVPVIEEAAGRSFLKIIVPENAAPGSYQGRVIVTPEEPGLSVRIIPVSIEVVPASEPAPVIEEDVPSLFLEPTSAEVAAASSGWQRTKIKVGVREGRPAVTIVGVRKNSLRGAQSFETISGRFDLRLAPAPGWSGKELAPGRRSTFLLEVYISSDLPDDVFEGQLFLQYRVGEEEKVREIPLSLKVTVRRSGD